MWDSVALVRINNEAHRRILTRELIELIQRSGIRVDEEVKRKAERFASELLPVELPPIY